MKSLRGFTLIELLVVISVLGVLATGLIVLINPLGQMEKTRDSIRKHDIAQISKAFESYSAANGDYPIDSSCVPPGCWAQLISNGTSVGPNLINSGDAKDIPKDPNDKTGIDYHNRYNWGDATGFGLGSCTASGPGTSYAVWAWLENPNDPDVSRNCTTGTPHLEVDSSGKTRGIYMIMNGEKL